jgi:hypothetical protein
MGDAFVIGDFIEATKEGTQLLCGAKFVKLPKGGDPKSKWFWRATESAQPKSKLIATKLKPKKGAPADQAFHYKSLTKDQRKANRYPKGHIFDNDSGQPNDELRVKWKDENGGAELIQPEPPTRNNRSLDPGEKAEDIQEHWEDLEAETSTLAGRVGHIGFSMKTPEPADYKAIMALPDSYFGKYSVTGKKSRTKSAGGKPHRRRPYNTQPEVRRSRRAKVPNTARTNCLPRPPLPLRCLTASSRSRAHLQA